MRTGNLRPALAAAAAAVATMAIPAQADDIQCQYSPYGNNPLGVFVRAHVYMATSVPVHVNYWVRDNGQLVPHAMQVRLTQDENALTWTLVEPTGAFLAALKNGALAQDKGCTASAPVSDKPPPM